MSECKKCKSRTKEEKLWLGVCGPCWGGEVSRTKTIKWIKR